MRVHLSRCLMGQGVNPADNVIGAIIRQARRWRKAAFSDHVQTHFS
jgi:hypothetical protein